MVIKKEPTWAAYYAFSLLDSLEIVYPDIKIIEDYNAKVIIIERDGIPCSHHSMDKNL